VQQAWGLPNLNLPILDVRYPHVVTGPSRFIYLKSSPKDTQPPGHIDNEESESVVVHDAGSKDDSEDPVESHSMEGAIEPPVQNLPEAPVKSPIKSHTSHQDGNPSPKGVLGPNVGGLGMCIQVGDCTPSPRSRKRSAKTASLPDSIPPDEDDDLTTRRKLLMTEADLILGRGEGFLAEDIPLPCQSLAKGPGSDPVDSLPDYETPIISPETSPSKSDQNNHDANANLLTAENLAMRDDMSESLRVCNGSQDDTQDTDQDEEDHPLSFEANGSTRDFTAITLSRVLPHPPATASVPEQIDGQDGPKLFLEDELVYFRTPPTVCLRQYQICLTIEVILRKGKSTDWWELDLRGLPRLPQLPSPESGYLYFRTPPGQGMEYSTLPFKRSTVIENCFMAQFCAGKSLLFPLRKCSAENYGFIHDYKINSAIHYEIFEEKPEYVIEYTAICSIDLVNHALWTEQCCFRLYVHNGPEGIFNAQFAQSQPPTNAGIPPMYNLFLGPASTARTGISRIEITCPPAALNMFAVQWEIKIPQSRGLVMPRIKNNSYDDVESMLENNLAFVDSEVYTLAKPVQSDQPDQPAQPEQRDKAAQPGHSGQPSQPKEPTEESPEKPSKPRRILHDLGRTTWVLVGFLFRGFCFLASVHTLYLSYFLVSHCYPEFPSPFCRNESLGFHARVNTTDSYNLTITSIDKRPIEHAELMQPETVQTEMMHNEDMPTEVVQDEISQAEPQQNDTIPLRDRIDYFLGWKGPLARE
jgi:hypothetical protein